MRDKLIVDLRRMLDGVSVTAADTYAKHAETMASIVNDALERADQTSVLLNTHERKALCENLRYHADSFSVALSARSAGLLLDVAKWECRRYAAHKVSPDYCKIEMVAWKDAVEKCIPGDGRAIADIYDLILRYNDDLVMLSQMPTSAVQVEEDAREPFHIYLGAMLKPSMDEALAVTRDYVSSVDRLRFWWLNVIRPALYEIGRLWEEGTITVKQEHIATSITQKVMAVFYPMVLDVPSKKGVVVVGTSPGDLHEIGPRMLSDLLAMRGWNAVYVGADTPVSHIADLVGRERARVLCVSTTVPGNLARSKALIDVLRATVSGRVAVMVGGQAYSSDESLWKWVGADGCGRNEDDVIACAEAGSGS